MNMPLIKIAVDDLTYAVLAKRRRAAGQPSIAAYLLSLSGLLTGDAEANAIADRALKLAKAKKPGAKFRLRDLFVEAEWDSFSRGARVRGGKLFYEKIGAAVDGIRPHSKSASNQQIYIKA
jgi:hypothetical protein